MKNVNVNICNSWVSLLSIGNLSHLLELLFDFYKLVTTFNHW